ncbi:MAG: hypothetical protein IPF67_03080 [Saprospiraceae bacterium]|nr:hypothetical protein [Candidatus Brachybacter algidus]
MKTKTTTFLLICNFLFCSSLYMTYGQGGWSVVDGAPTDDRFNDVSFINDSAGYIGNGYWIYKTVNKGDTWLRQKQLSKPLYFKVWNS